jgi:metal-responsive CopG/Arc/MetJ family transcriptional regulator
MGNTGKRMKVVSFKLPEELDSALTSLSKQRGVSRSELVREAIAGLACPRTGSAIEAAGKLVGCLEGPEDLSTSSLYLEDFGK